MARKLLLADDSVTIQKVVGISFANEDVELMTVDNGDDAIARARESRPDVILADVVMPGKNGYEVCQAVKADPQLAGVPVLLLTGTFEAFDEERARSVGADGHITKPFEAQALVDRVNALLARAAAAPPPAAAPEADDLPAPRAAEGPARTAPAAAEPAAGAVDRTTSLRDSTDPLAAPGVADPLADSGADLGAPGDDEGFDFFDEGLAEEAPSPAAAPESEAPAATAFELDAGESAFDFAPLAEPEAAPPPDATRVVEPSDATRAVEPPPAAPAPSPAWERPDDSRRDATVVMAPPAAGGGTEDDWPSSADLDAAFDGGDLDDGESGPDLEPADPDDELGLRSGEHYATADQPTVLQLEDEAPPEPPEERMEFGPASGPQAAPEDDLFGGFDSGEASREAVLDPDRGGDFAVSSSDLGDPLDLGGAGAPAGPEPEMERPFGAAPEPVELAAEEPEARTEAAVLGEPDGLLGSSFQERMHGAGTAVHRAPSAEPLREAAFAEPEHGLGPAEPEAELRAAEPPAAAPPAAGPAAAAPDLTPMMRERLHESLEKVAWEAFADLPEQIVRQAVAKVEEIAWEVIPQMAEALVREEIRRMKGES